MMRQALATFCSSWARCSNESFRRVLWAKAAIRNLLSDGLSQQLPISQKAGWSPLCFLQPAPAATCRIITALLQAASSWARISWPCPTKFERPNLILWRSHEIRSFDDHNTEAPHSAVDTGAPDGPNFAAV